MEIGAKTIAAGVGLFLLGGLSVYLLTAKTDAPVRPTTQHQTAAMQEALAQVRASKTPAAVPEAESNEDTPAIVVTTEVVEELTHDAFLAQAEARREQQFIDKAEADRLAKLKAAKERSVECKFWKQQQKTSSAAAKIDEKINAHCNLPSSSSASESSAASESSTPVSSSTSSVES